MNNKIENFKAERDQYKNIVSRPIDAIRAKLEINERTAKGYAIVWGSKNDYGEIVLKGATQNSLNMRGVNTASGNPILVLNQHRQSEPLFRPTVLQEDDYGLYFEGEIVSGVSYANDVVNLKNAGVLRQLSYGFNYIWDKTEYDATLDAYILKEINLGEISLVTFSSDPNAQLRSFNEFQETSFLNTFSQEQIEELQNILRLRTAKQNPDKEEGKSNVTLF